MPRGSRLPTATSGADHFLPGLDVEPGTSGADAHLALPYYFYPGTNCDETTCQLDVGFVSSPDGGSTWTQPVQIAGPYKLTSLPYQRGLHDQLSSGPFRTATATPSAAKTVGSAWGGPL